MDTRLEQELDKLLAELGYELVALERGGGRRRPLLRLRVDRPGGQPGRSAVTVEDCSRVSRAVREHLEARQVGEGPTDYILEVSSPGVERPLVRKADWERFGGERVRLSGYGPLVGSSRQVEGELVGLSGGGEDVVVILQLDGQQVEVPLRAIARATLAFDFSDDL